MAGDVPTSTERWRSALTGQAASWAALVVVTAALVLATWPMNTTSAVRRIDGPWSAGAPGQVPVLVAVPSLNPPVPAGPLVFRATVDLPPGLDRPAVEVAAANYLTAVRWDGRTLYRAPTADGAPVLTEQGQVLGVDGDPGPHQLEIELQPGLGRLGVLRHVRIGPADELGQLQRQRDGAEVGFALGMFLLGIVHLSVAGATGGWTTHLWFGLFLATMGAWTWGNADASYAVFPDAEARYRVVRLAYGLVPGLGLSFLQHFLARAGRTHVAILAVGGALSLAGVVAPTSVLYRIEQAQDLFTLAVTLFASYALADAWRRRTTGSGLLALSTVPLLLASVHEMAITHGYLAAESILFPGLVLFIAASSAGLATGEARASVRHRRLVTGSIDAMLMIDVQGQIAFANPAVEQMLGPWTAREGSSLFAAVVPEDRASVRTHVARSVTRPDRAEFRIGVEGRELTVESIATPVDAGTVLLVLRDITRRRQIDRGLLQAARMETVAVLVGGIAHDFNNMLGNLLAQIGLMQAAGPSPDATRRLSKMESTIERASVLTRRLLTVAGGTSSDLVPTDVSAFLRGAVDLVEPSLPPTIELVLDLPPDLPPVLGAHVDLEQVVVNLLVNARDALGPQGRIRVVARPFFARNGARGVGVCVEDDGPGVPAHLRTEIFEPFFSTKPPSKGSGLGLAVASQILRDHYGRLWLEDRPAGGSRFLLALRTAEGVDAGPVHAPAGRHVLVAEDDPALLDSYTKALTDAGYTVIGCGSGHEAWEALHRTPPDILVTDVVMPGFSGLDLAALCAELYPTVPVLLVSGFIPEDQIAPLSKGSWFRLDKPVRSVRLVATVGRLLRRAERVERGEIEISEVNTLFPPLDELTADNLGI